MLRGTFRDFSYSVHTHDVACLALITRGAIRIKMRGSELVARQGDIYAIEADEPHQGWPVDETGWSQRTIYLDLRELASRVSEEGSPKSPVRIKGPILRDPAFAQLFCRLHRSSELGAEIEAGEEAIRFARDFLGKHCTDSASNAVGCPDDGAIRRALDYIDANLGRRFDLHDIAAEARRSPFQIYRAFERSVGMTPHAYQRQARIRLAVRLIREGFDIAEVAVVAGFADQAHLTRAFARQIGLTPGRFRAALSL